MVDSGSEWGRNSAGRRIACVALFVGAMMTMASAWAIPSNAVAGRLLSLGNISSPQLGNVRRVQVYLPANYARESSRRYPVLYMHDGQNHFDPKTSFSGVAWDVGTTVDRLIAEGQVRPFIVVAIDNTAERLAEYTPGADPRHGGGRLDAYADFVLDTLKPMIDARFRTLPDRRHTAWLGSSLGGLASLHVALARSDRVALAAGMSPAVWWNRRALIEFVKSRTPRPPVRLYLDAGTDNDDLEEALDLSASLQEVGYVSGQDFRLLVVKGGNHHERDWAARLAEPLRFLFPPEAGHTRKGIR